MLEPLVEVLLLEVEEVALEALVLLLLETLKESEELVYQI